MTTQADNKRGRVKQSALWLGVAIIGVLAGLLLRSCARPQVRPDKLEIGWFVFVPVNGSPHMLESFSLAGKLRTIQLDTQSPETAARGLEATLGKRVRIVDSGVKPVLSDGTTKFSADLKGFSTEGFQPAGHPENVYKNEEKLTLSPGSEEVNLTFRDRTFMTDDHHPQKFFTEWISVPKQKVAVNHGLLLGSVPPRDRGASPIGIYAYIREKKHD